MTKAEIIDRLVEDIRERANKMTVKQLKDLMGRNGINTRKKKSK